MSLDTSQFTYASFGQRFVAALIDGVLLALIVKFLVAIASRFLHPGAELLLAPLVVKPLLQMIVAVALYVVPLAKTGQSPGKRLMGIRVLSLDGDLSQGLGFTDALARELPGKTISLLSVVGYFLALRPSRQALHDICMKTIVVSLKD